MHAYCTLTFIRKDGLKVNDSICEQTATERRIHSVFKAWDWSGTCGKLWINPQALRGLGRVIWVLLEGLGFKCFFSRFPVIQGWGMSDNTSIEYMQPMFQPKSWFSDFAICATNDGSLSLSPYPENSSFPFLNPGPINMLNTCSRVPCPQGDIGHFEAYVMRPMT